MQKKYKKTSEVLNNELEDDLLNSLTTIQKQIIDMPGKNQDFKDECNGLLQKCKTYINNNGVHEIADVEDSLSLKELADSISEELDDLPTKIRNTMMEMESSFKHNMREDLNKFTELVDTFIGLTKNKGPDEALKTLDSLQGKNELMAALDNLPVEKRMQ